MKRIVRSMAVVCVAGLAASVAVGGQPSKPDSAPAKPAQPAAPSAPAPANTPAKSAAPSGDPKPAAPAEVGKSKTVADPYVLGYKMKDIDGKEQDLAQYKGKVVLMVNVASKCGYTPQYTGLEALYEKYKDKGLVILGFPANDFGAQEPGNDDEIKAFCTSKYKVTFPMFSKIVVTGEKAHDLYKQLAGQKDPAGGPPKWNFSKYLVNREGKVVEHFDSGVKPDSDDLKKKIEHLLDPKSGAETK